MGDRQLYTRDTGHRNPEQPLQHRLSPTEQGRRSIQEARTRKIVYEYLESAQRASPDSRSGWPSHKMNAEAYRLIISDIKCLSDNDLYDKSIANTALVRLNYELRAAEFEESVLEPHQQNSDKDKERATSARTSDNTRVADPSRPRDSRLGLPSEAASTSDMNNEHIDILLDNFDPPTAKSLSDFCKNLNSKNYSNASTLKEIKTDAMNVYQFTSLPNKDRPKGGTSRETAREAMRKLRPESLKAVKNQLIEEKWRYRRWPDPIDAFINEIRRIEQNNPSTSGY